MHRLDVTRLRVGNGHFIKSHAGEHGGCLFLRSIMWIDLDSEFDACVSSNGRGKQTILESTEMGIRQVEHYMFMEWRGFLLHSMFTMQR